MAMDWLLLSIKPLEYMLLNPMEKIGLVSKEANPRDARVSLVELTVTGLKTYQQASNTLNQMASVFFERVDAKDSARLHKLLGGLNV